MLWATVVSIKSHGLTPQTKRDFVWFGSSKDKSSGKLAHEARETTFVSHATST